MKVSGGGVSSFLSSPPKGLCGILVYGHDRGLISERSTHLAKHYAPDISDPFAVTRLSGSDIIKTPPLLADSASVLPPFGGFRLVRVDDAGADCLAACKMLAERTPPDSICILSGNDTLTTKSALVKLFDQSPSLAALGCYADTSRSLRDLATSIFAEADIQANRDVLDWITAHLGNDRLLSRGEIEKLVLRAGSGGVLTLELVQSSLGDGSSIVLNDAIHASASGDIPALSHSLTRLWDDGISGDRLLRSGQYYFKRLSVIAAAIESGVSPDKAFTLVKPPIFFSERPKISAHLKHWNARRARQARDRLATAEHQSRQGIPANTAASQAFLSIAHAARGGTALHAEAPHCMRRH